MVETTPRQPETATGRPEVGWFWLQSKSTGKINNTKHDTKTSGGGSIQIICLSKSTKSTL